MSSIVEGIVISYLVSHLAAGAPAEATAMQQGFDNWLNGTPVLANHPDLKKAIEDGADPLINAAGKVLADQADVKAAIVALASKNWAAAAAALLAAAKQAVPGLGVAA